MKPIKFLPIPILIALLAGATNPTQGQGADLIAQQAYLKASNTGMNDEFGGPVAISGDTMVIGARLEDSDAIGVNGKQTNNNAIDSGAAYVFVRNGTNWSQQAYLKASNTGTADIFGISVAASGETIVIGAPNEASDSIGVNSNQSNNSALSAGAAYVFVRNGTNWSQQAYLKASNTGSGDFFGYSVAIFGDTVVVGAPSEDSNASDVNGDQANNLTFNAGAVYVFVRSGTNWGQQAYLKASRPGYDDRFGGTLAFSAGTLVVGVGFEDSNATGVNGDQANNSLTNSGAAYVFVRNGTNWTQQAYLKASNTGADDEFGIAVALSGDTVVVGANLEDSNATGVNGDQSDVDAEFNSGAAYVFVRDGTNWTQQAYLKASNTGLHHNFGLAVGVSGDTVVSATGGEGSDATGVNGNQSDNSATLSGAAYVFVRTGTNWIQQAYLKASNTGAGDVFGEFAAMSGDTLVIGATWESSNATGVNGNQSNNSAPNSGAAYVFTGFGSPMPQLMIDQSAGNVRILWPLSAANFVLDEADDLNFSPTVGWTQVPFPYQTNATHVSIISPVPAGNKFYRLRKP